MRLGFLVFAQLVIESGSKNMWTKEIFGTDIYHLLAAFAIYSMMGWLLESIYMSFCNKKLTNRGFAKGPFCPIYGFGAVIGYLILNPFRGHGIAVYLLGALSATAFEFLVGIAMIRFLGSLWWDYNEKPFNYKGIICLESTVAWGFYALGVVYFVNGAVNNIIDRVSMKWGIYMLVVVLLVAMIDYCIQLLKVFDVDVIEKSRQIKRYWVSLMER